MDKEQIIVDGVDVRTCDSFIDYYMVDNTRFQDVPEDIIEQDKLPMVYKGLPDCLLRKNLCDAHICHCKDKPNCHFKQLARKTQECEIWKNQVLILDEASITVQVTQEQFEEYQQLRQECEKLKEKFKKFSNIDNQECWDIAFLKDENARYRRALNDIGKIVIQDRNIKDVCLISTCLDAGRVAYDIQQQIIDIINKVKEEGK